MAKKLIILLFTGVFLTACITVSDNPRKQKKKIDLYSIKQKADTAYTNGDYDSAEAYYREYLDKTEKAADIWFRLGNILSRTNRLQAALNAYNKSVEQDPDYYKSWYNMAVIYMKLSAQSFYQAQRKQDDNSPLHKEIVQRLDLLNQAMGNKKKGSQNN